VSAEAHSVDIVLRDVAGDPSPSASDVLAGRRLLVSAIAAERAPDARRRAHGIRWRWVAAASSVVALVAAVAVTGLLRPRPVTALGELAQVAERVERAPLAAGTYDYVRATESRLLVVAGSEIGLADRAYVAYAVPLVRDRWVSGDGVIHEEVTHGQPVFFDSVVEAAYATSGLAVVDRIGATDVAEFTREATVLGVREWPTSRDELVVAMRAYVSGRGSDVAEVAALVDLAADLLRASGATPKLRGAVIAALDTLDVDVATRREGGGLAVAVEFEDVVRARRVLEFDASANLVRDRLMWLEDAPLYGVPAGTAFFDTQLSPSRVVESHTRP